MCVPSFCSTNFGALLLYERGGWVQNDENRYWTPGQVWCTRIGIKLLAFVSPEKIAFPCEVFLKFCLIFVYHTFLNNFGALLLYEREGWVQIDGNRYWTAGQAWFTQIGIKLLAYVSAEKIVLGVFEILSDIMI